MDTIPVLVNRANYTRATEGEYGFLFSAQSIEKRNPYFPVAEGTRTSLGSGCPQSGWIEN
jgi:hypothetical protein